jgi:predicted nucleic acid-binding protein
MIFTDLPNGAAVFLDANTIVYHFSQHPRYGVSCTDLMERIARQDLVGHTSTHVLGEAAHRLMALEAIDRLGWSNTGIANRLRRHPTEVQQLQRFRQAIEEIPLFGIQVHTITFSHLSAALGLCQAHGFLTNDALLVARFGWHSGITRRVKVQEGGERAKPALLGKLVHLAARHPPRSSPKTPASSPKVVRRTGHPL